MLSPLAHAGRCADFDASVEALLLRCGTVSRRSLFLARIGGPQARLGRWIQKRRDRSVLRALSNFKESLNQTDVEFLLFTPSVFFDAGGFLSIRRSFLKFANFRALMPVLSDITPVSIIFLHREFSAAAASCLRRNFESEPHVALLGTEIANGLCLHFRHQLLESGFACLDVDFDELVNRPEETASHLAEFLELELADLDTQLHPPDPNPSLEDVMAQSDWR